MNPAPGLLSDWIQIPGFPLLVLGCILLACLGTVIVQFVRVRQETGAEMDDAIQHVDDDHVQQQVARYHCAGHGCQLRTFYSDEGGTTWVCVNCGRSYWVPVADVYDQTKDGVA